MQEHTTSIRQSRSLVIFSEFTSNGDLHYDTSEQHAEGTDEDQSIKNYDVTLESWITQVSTVIPDQQCRT